MITVQSKTWNVFCPDQTCTSWTKAKSNED